MPVNARESPPAKKQRDAGTGSGKLSSYTGALQLEVSSGGLRGREAGPPQYLLHGNCGKLE